MCRIVSEEPVFQSQIKVRIRRRRHVDSTLRRQRCPWEGRQCADKWCADRRDMAEGSEHSARPPRRPLHTTRLSATCIHYVVYGKWSQRMHASYICSESGKYDSTAG